VIVERRFRLRANADFQRIRREGKSWSNRWLVLIRAANQESTSRFGFAIGKKLGGAVGRNRLKRQLREAIRRRLRDDRIVSGFDIVIIARQPVVDAPYRVIEGALDDLLQRAGLVREAATEEPNE